MMKKCDKHEELLKHAQQVLQRIHELTARQKAAITESGVSELFLHMDSELELAMGEKERAVGALREHDEEHVCQTGPQLGSPNERGLN